MFFINTTTQWLRTAAGLEALPAARLPVMSGVLTLPGAPFSVAPGDVVTVWFCRPR